MGGFDAAGDEAHDQKIGAVFARFLLRGMKQGENPGREPEGHADFFRRSQCQGAQDILQGGGALSCVVEQLGAGDQSLDQIEIRALRFAAIHKIVKNRSEEHTSELQSLMRISYAVFCLKKITQMHEQTTPTRAIIK